MLRWLVDENFNNNIVRALFRESRDLDIVRAQDAGLAGKDDETLLAWAAMQDRILLTHDVSTITAHAYRRVMKDDRMPGVFEVSQRVPVRAAVERRSPAHGMQPAWRMGRPGPISSAAIARGG